jgi:hypothetical protein
MIDVEVGRSPGGRRRFPVAFRLEFLRMWDARVDFGGKTQLLREYGLAHCTVRRWVVARDAGEFERSMLTASQRSRNSVNNQDRAELARLRQENAALQAKVKQAEAAQEILGKAFEILDGIAKTSTDSGPAIPLSAMSAEEYSSWLKRLNLF